MRAAFLTDFRRVEMDEVPLPVLETPRDVLLRVETVGVCGSDVHYYTLGRIGSQVVTFPFIVGHECAATVVRTGAEVEGLTSGQLVTIDPLVACGECDQCRSGRRHTCRNQKFLGSAGQLPGALREYLVMPAECCFPVPASLTATRAAVVEPFSIGLYAQRMAGLYPGSKVGILGSGPIGLCVLLALRAALDCKVYVTDLLDERLRVAEQCGADWTGNATRGRVVKDLLALEPEGLDVVFECAGEQDALDQGTQLLKPGGTLLIVGIPEVDRISFDINLLRRHELRLVNVRRQNECVAPAIELIASGKINLDPLVTHHFDFEETGEAFDMVAARRDGVVKAIIHVQR